MSAVGDEAKRAGEYVQRFTVEPADGWTECDCPESLCTHNSRDGGPLGMRPYRAWTVWDNERDEHAYITVPRAQVDVEYLRKRDATATARRLNTPALFASSGAGE